MIIECDQCKTKFRLDDSRIGPNGVKVRCTKCQNVFIVTPPPPPEEVHVEEVFGEQAPFSEKPRQSFDSAGTDAQQEEGSDWGVFNSDAGEDEGEEDWDFGAGQHTEEGGDDEEDEGEMEDGNREAPDLSFGGPDFSTIPGLTGQEPATETPGASTKKKPEDEGGEDNSVEGKNDGPWFEGVADHDDGFPEDGPEEGTPASGEAPFVDNLPSHSEDENATLASPASDEEEAPGNEPEEERGPDSSFDISSGQEEGAQAAPFDKFDFGIDDEREQGEGAKQEEADDWGPTAEEDAPEEPATEIEPESPMDETGAPEPEEEKESGEDFSLTPPTPTTPAEPPAKQKESSGTEKVIPFSTGYGRNGKSAKTGAGDENRFEDLFSRTLSEQEAGPDTETAEPLHFGQDEEMEFDRHELPPETAAEEAEEAEEAEAQKPAVGMGVLIAVLIFILGAGAIYFSGVIDNMARTLTATAPAEAVQIETITGYMAVNKHFGRYFVIEAKIKNASSEAQSIDRITGVIYDDKGRSIATRSVSPGRVVSEDDLKNLTKGELLAQFSDSSGGMIPPKGTVPVMVPFTEIPAGMAEYGLKIIRE